jgi:hypothetical protein
MIKLGSKIKLFSLFSFIFFAASLGSFKGLVLCFGADGHIHTEITFNGVDCGHFAKTVLEATGSDYLTRFNHTPHATHCISCVDIPLATDYSLKKIVRPHTQLSPAKVPFISSDARIANTPLKDLTHLASLQSPSIIVPTLDLIHNIILIL